MDALVGGISLYLYVRVFSNRRIRKKRLGGLLWWVTELHGSPLEIYLKPSS